MKTLTNAVISVLMSAMVLPLGAEAKEGVKVDHLGINNTLVRVEGNSHYLLLPVQEANDAEDYDK